MFQSNRKPIIVVDSLAISDDFSHIFTNSLIRTQQLGSSLYVKRLVLQLRLSPFIPHRSKDVGSPFPL